MGRIGDDKTEQQMREVNQRALNKKIIREKKDGENRTEKSFKDVMSQKAANRAHQDNVKREGAKNLQNTGQKVLNQLVKKKMQKNPAELARKAAMSQAKQGKRLEQRASMGQQVRSAAGERVDELLRKTSSEVEQVDTEAREEEEQEYVRSEEKAAEKKAENQDGRVDRHQGQRQQGRQQDDRGGGQDGADGVKAADGPRKAHKVQIPRELIEKLVNTIYQAVSADGRTSLQIDLKGKMLEGVRLSVSAENGKVKCAFEGCDKQLKNLLNSSKGALMRGLSGKGLDLVGMSVK